MRRGTSWSDRVIPMSRRRLVDMSFRTAPPVAAWAVSLVVMALVASAVWSYLFGRPVPAELDLDVVQAAGRPVT